MDIYLFDTLSGEKKKFEPLKPGEVSMYNCGPTVYNYAHLGNLRSYVFADVLRRMFEYNGYKVRQVINITDIGHLSGDGDEGEDKMTKALKRLGKPMTLEAVREVANLYFEEFKKDLEALNIELPEKFPFASENINEDIELVEKLQNAGFTYTTSDGIYFDTSKFSDYGKLGNIFETHDDRSRIGINKEKKNPRDFAVWKFNNEFGYDASFGKGFPGWHIECTAMSVKYLGKEFDIHTGGIDHIPVHHNNEIAQAKCAGYPYAHIWMHNAFLNVDTGKMAKSEENFLKLKDLEERKVDPLAYRYLLLTARYSSPIQFSWEALDGSLSALKKLRAIISAISSSEESRSNYKDKFLSLINDDLDTAKALALVWDLVKDEKLSDGEKKYLLLDFDKVLGLRLDKAETFEIPEEVGNLIKERDLARNDKNFAKSDEIRQKIESFGFEVMDTPEGTKISPR